MFTLFHFLFLHSDVYVIKNTRNLVIKIEDSHSTSNAMITCTVPFIIIKSEKLVPEF